jgi:hypothetical protein
MCVFRRFLNVSTLQSLNCIRCRSPRLERVARAGLFKKVAEKCKRVRHCPHCGAVNGTVRFVWKS